MACTTITLKGLNAICKEGNGGVKRAWIAVFEDVKDSDITVDKTTGLVTIADDAIAAFKAYRFRRNSASFNQEGQFNENAGNTVSANFTMDFLKMDAVKRLEIQALMAGGTRAVVEDSNGVMHLMGLTYPLETTAFTGETGTAQTDANHYSITLTDEAAEIEYILDDETAEKFIAIEPVNA